MGKSYNRKNTDFGYEYEEVADRHGQDHRRRREKNNSRELIRKWKDAEDFDDDDFYR